MPVPILQKIKFNPDGGQIKVDLKFQTMLLCTYTLDLREVNCNASVVGFLKQGDNSNPEDDIYPLPMPSSVNNNRNLWAAVTVIDQSANGGKYKVDLTVRQDGNQLGILTTGEKELKSGTQMEILVAKLIV